MSRCLAIDKYIDSIPASGLFVLQYIPGEGVTERKYGLTARNRVNNTKSVFICGEWLP